MRVGLFPSLFFFSFFCGWVDGWMEEISIPLDHGLDGWIVFIVYIVTSLHRYTATGQGRESAITEPYIALHPLTPMLNQPL